MVMIDGDDDDDDDITHISLINIFFLRCLN